MEEQLRAVGVRMVRTPASAPNCNAHAERFIRSIKTECLDCVVPLGEWHLRQLVRDFVEHHHAERNHQGIGNELIEWPPGQPTAGPGSPTLESAACLVTTTARSRSTRSSECGTLRGRAGLVPRRTTQRRLKIASHPIDC
jgi:hypothetical protein